MTRIWNPYVFTPLGNHIVGEAPPALRVMGGMQATAGQLSHAQQRFVQFVMQTRLSTVPNPTEVGRLPDGTQYRIVKLGPQTTMEIWPAGTESTGDSGVLVDDSALPGVRTWLFKPKGRYAQPSGAWEVLRVNRGTGQGSWHARTGREYFVFRDGYYDFLRGGQHVITAYPDGVWSMGILSSSLQQAVRGGRKVFVCLFVGAGRTDVFTMSAPAVPIDGPLPKTVALDTVQVVVDDAQRNVISAALHPDSRLALVSSYPSETFVPGDFRQRAFPVYVVQPHGTIPDVVGTYERFIVAHHGVDTSEVSSLPPVRVHEYSNGEGGWGFAGVPLSPAASESTPSTALWRRSAGFGSVSYRGEGYAWSLPQMPELETFTMDGVCSYPDTAPRSVVARRSGPVHYIEGMRCDTGDCVRPFSGSVKEGGYYLLDGAKVFVAERTEYEARAEVRGTVSYTEQDSYRCTEEGTWGRDFMQHIQEGWTTDAEITVSYKRSIRTQTGQFALRSFSKREDVTGAGERTADYRADVFETSSFTASGKTRVQDLDRMLFAYDPQFEMLAYLEVEYEYTRDVTASARLRKVFPSSDPDILSGTAGDEAALPALPQPYFVVRVHGREVFRRAVPYDTPNQARRWMIAGTTFPMAKTSDSASGASAIGTDMESTVPITITTSTMARRATEFGHTRDEHSGASGVIDRPSYTRRAFAFTSGVLSAGFSNYDTYYAKDPRTGGAVLAVKRTSGGFSFAFVVDDTGARPLESIAPEIAVPAITLVAQT